MNKRIKEEKDFLIDLAVLKFNQQYGRSFKKEQFTIKSIPKKVQADRSYEIKTKRQDDFLVLHLHCRFASSDGISSFRLENARAAQTGQLGDETYVADASIDNYYIRNGIYKFAPINEDSPVTGASLLLEDGTELLLEDGTPILLETAA